MNLFAGMGRLTADPELKASNSGTQFTSFTVAINRPKDKNGVVNADFIPCVAFGKTAELICKYFKKGSGIVVNGPMQSSNYTDKNGVKQYRYNVMVNQIHFPVANKGENSANNAANNAAQAAQNVGYIGVSPDDELPF